MRIKLLLLLFIIGIGFSLGCRSRRHAETTVVDPSPDVSVNNSYWEKREDYRPAFQSQRLINSGLGQSVEIPQPFRFLNPLKNDVQQVTESPNLLTCQSCQQKQMILVDGLCARCGKNQLGQHAVNGSVNQLPPVQGQLVTPQQHRLPPSQLQNAQRVPNPPASIQPLEKITQQPPRLPTTNQLPSSKMVSTPNNPKSQQFFNTKELPVTNPSEAPAAKFESKIDERALKTFEDNSGGIADTGNNDYLANTGELEEDIKDVTNEKPSDSTHESKNELNANAANEEQVDESNSPIEGSASLDSNPKFETFSLDDLFGMDTQKSNPKDSATESVQEKSAYEDDIEWGPPSKIDHRRSNQRKATRSKTRQKSKSGTPRQSEPPRPSQSEPPRPDYLRSSRTESQVFKDLAHATIKEKIVFDNSPVIQEELALPNNPIVLKAKPSQFYHEIQRIAAQKKKEAIGDQLVLEATELINTPAMEPDSIENAPVLRKSRIPILQAKTSSRIAKKRYDFTPLPELNEVVDEVLTLDAVSEISHKVFDPNEFPLASPVETSQQPFTSSDKAQATSTIVASKEKDRSGDLTKKPGSDHSILLRAVPEQTEGDSQTLQVPEKSKAQFRFVQPSTRQSNDK